VGGPTLAFFFTLHYLLPFAVLAFVGLHLIFLHETGRTSPLTSNDSNLRVRFSPFFTRKDFLNLIVMGVFFIIVFFSP
jgi:ubiquinol-cytochrome c reductase cytochrome b subunit